MKLTTTNLRLPRARWIELSPPVAATICIFLLLLIGLIVGRVRSTPSVAAVPTPALDAIIIIASPLPVVPPTAAAAVAALPPNALRRAVVAYDAPGGNVLGAIEQGRTVQGSSAVWERLASGRRSR